MLTAILLAIVAAAMLLVHRGWRLGVRGVSAAGWLLAGIATAVLTSRDGAWGVAIATVAGMSAALAIVLHAGWRSPARSRRPVREAPAIALPRRWDDVLHRFAVFALVVPVGFVAAEALAFGAQAVARRGGAAEADAIVLTLFLQPVAWTALMTIQMTRAGAARMVAPPLIAAAIGAILWSAS